MPELVASLQQLHVEGDVGAAREKVEVGPKGTPNAVLGVFRFTDLPVELQDMILDQVILSTQHNGHELSRLAVVSRTWQEHIEKITFATLGACSTGSIRSASSPFRATDLREFQRILVVGKRRTILRHITIDFNLDAEGTPESQDFNYESWQLFDDICDKIRGNGTAVRRCKRFGYYTNVLFCILHTWDASQAGPSYLDVNIRVCGTIEFDYDHLKAATRMYANLTKLPPVSVIRSFHLIHHPRGRDPDGDASVDCIYVHPISINQILDRLPLLHSAITHVQLSQPARMTLSGVDSHSLEGDQRARGIEA